MLECAYCNRNDLLHDEGDTVYCSNCARRTFKATGELYLVKCPYCKKKTTGKAATCRECGEWIADRV
ncbi:hypothetical protein [Bacillus sp. FJAT-18017]|uniref:hypothetical protein n=1 Tax=Bacillus sp. FJAT-18017 TaxID=1705566 RepID=UPI0012E310E5|nr:hypothetical protein [Bacillus sp. FJAT-18017]